MIKHFIELLIVIIFWIIILSIKNKFSKSNEKNLINNSIDYTVKKNNKIKYNDDTCYYCGSSYNQCEICDVCGKYKCKVCGKCKCDK